jgi:hypothetical protein
MEKRSKGVDEENMRETKQDGKKEREDGEREKKDTYKEKRRKKKKKNLLMTELLSASLEKLC